MSVQAITAVRRYSSFIKDRDFGAYRVLEAIADAADEFGVCGIAGNPRKCLSYSGIADSARVHRNTVFNLMPALLESGEVEIVGQGGNGRGSWTVYRVTIVEKLSQVDVTFIEKSSQAATPPQESSQETPESSQDKAVTIRLVTIIEELSQRVAELSQRIAESSQENPESSQGIVTIVTSNGCDRSVESRMSSDEFREEGETPPLPPQKQQLAEMVNALAEVTVMDGHANWGILSQTAVELLDTYTPGQVRLHYGLDQPANGHWNWYLHDWRGQKHEPPAPAHIRATIKRAVKGMIPAKQPAAENGHSPGKPPVDVGKIFDELGLSHE